MFIKDIETLKKLIRERIEGFDNLLKEWRKDPEAVEEGAKPDTVSGKIMAYEHCLGLIRSYEQTERLNQAINGVLESARQEQKPAYIRFTYRDTPWMVQISAITRLRISKPDKPDQEIALEISVTGEPNTLYIRGKQAEMALKVLPCIDLEALAQLDQQEVTV